MSGIDRRYLPETWMDPRQDIRPSTIHGMGVVAREPIQQGAAYSIHIIVLVHDSYA